MLYQQRYDEIHRACQQMLTHRQVFAKPAIEKLIQQRVDVETSNSDLMAHLVAESLLKRLDRNLLVSKNIYIQQFDIPQIIMFYKMIQSYPHVQVSHGIANQYLEHVIKAYDLKEFTILEIGIGKALQLKNLIHSLIHDGIEVKSIKIIGIDPNEENLFDSGNLINELKKTLTIDLEYYPVHKLIENFDEKDYETIKAIAGENLLINSAYTLHHIYHPLDDNELRTSIFRQLKKLNPIVFTLTEPNSNHDTENLAERLHNCWSHFGAVFELVDESNISPAEKFSVKEKFFGREIRDIFGVADKFRSERHEDFGSWMLRFARAGFEPLEYVPVTAKLDNNNSYTVSEGLVRLNYKDTPLIAVFAYKGNN